MDIWRNSRGVLASICLLITPAIAQSPGPPQPPAPVPQAAGQPDAPLRVTTDSVEYCGWLADKVETYPDPPDEVRILLVEGRRMCSNGHVIGGVARLRLAVTIMRGDPHKSP